FDNGGYEERGAATTDGAIDKESLAEDIDEIARRIEVNVSGMAANWFTRESEVESALALVFGLKDKEGNDLYRTNWTGSRGRRSFQGFEFTPEGIKHLQSMLQRDSRGRFDSFGGRVRRRLY